jgi:hypothetical protein
VRALDKLRGGVEEAIKSLGTGFLSHRSNLQLREALGNGQLDAQEYYRQLLRLVYRLIFLFVAEEREVLLDPDADPVARDRYLRFYATRRLRDLAERRRGSPHGDLWQGLRMVMSRLDDGCPELGLPALDSWLWQEDCCPWLMAAECANEHLLAAIRRLSTVEEDRTRYPVSWRNVGAEELGSIYESLLELHPRMERDAGTFELDTAAGHERKITGSYYTPSSLVDCLLDSALDPVLDEAVLKADPEKAILDLKVCDPACGSGHFLVAAARRMAKRLAAVRSGDDEPSPRDVQHALRDVVGSCIFGVDLNPMAVELCKVALWMEALEPGKPLSFLDAHIQCGNSLLGATPALLSRGIPDAAFKPITGDDKKVCSKWRKVNKQERETRQLKLFDYTEREPWERLGDLATAMAGLEAVDDDTIDGIRKRQQIYEEHVHSSEYLFSRLWADAWCAAFVWKKDDEFEVPITDDILRRIEENPYGVSQHIRDEAQRIAREYRFFHWHLAFPQVFQPLEVEDISDESVTGWDGGFDVVLGNPPWDRIKLQEKEFFAQRSEKIANAPNAAERRRMIKALAEDDPALLEAWLDAKRRSEGESQLVRMSGRFPLCGRGDVNTYSVFAELNRTAIGPRGRVGCIVPTGIATDDTTKHFFRDLMAQAALQSLFDLQSGPDLFAGVGHGMFKFCLLTLRGYDAATTSEAEFAFFLRSVNQLKSPERRFTLNAEDISVLNPNTGTCPIFSTRRDAEITKGVYSRVPVLIREGTEDENPWGMSFQRMFDMANDSGLFCTRGQLEAHGWRLAGNVFERISERYVPLYEAKMIWHFDHRYASLIRDDSQKRGPSRKYKGWYGADVGDPIAYSIPRYWVSLSEVEERLSGRWNRGWLLGWRDICRSADVRTVVTSIIPTCAVGHTTPLFILPPEFLRHASFLYSNLASFVFDYVARNKIGGTHLTYGLLNQLPVLEPASYEKTSLWESASSVGFWLKNRTLELTYTAWDLEPFAKDCGYDGPPFRWDEERRFLLRCELDAAFFHLYSIERDDVDYIMETFPIVKRKDVAQWGSYRTKEQILDIYDRLQRAIDTGEPYQTLLEPPPADPSVAHSPSTRPPWAAVESE